MGRLWIAKYVNDFGMGVGKMNSQKQELRESGVFRQKVLDRFLNGMEPDSPMVLNAWPVKIGIGALIAFGGTLLVWWCMI